MRISTAFLLIAASLAIGLGQQQTAPKRLRSSQLHQANNPFTFQPMAPPHDALVHRPVVRQQRQPSTVIRQQRQQKEGYQYNQPSPAFFLPSSPAPTPAKPQVLAAVFSPVPTPSTSFVASVASVTRPAVVSAPLVTRPAGALAPVTSRPFVTRPVPTRPATTVDPDLSYIPPAPTPIRPVPPPPAPPAPVTFPPVTLPPPTLPVTFPTFVEPIRPLPTLPAFTSAPVTSPPVTLPPTTFLPPPVPTSSPVIAEPNPVDPMALMPQLPSTLMPQIEFLDAQCATDSMIVTIRFDRVFNGLIYSKGFHSARECIYVPVNSGRDTYEFVIRLNSCGSQWVDQLGSGGQAYLENIIIIQNEEGIQEIWDTARTLRCLWEGSLSKTVSYTLNVDMLDTQVVSFAGDTATAVMDVQIGKGPTAPSASGLIKIGETLTMVIYIEGDAGFDVHVQDCIAHDGDRSNAVTLTDTRGCVLKKKLMGPWQKTRDTAGIRQGVSLVAYSFFQAFKFPDTMDVFLECNVELCKNGCDICPDDAALFGRKRRATDQSLANNGTVSDVRLSRRVRVISSEDISLTPDGRSAVTLTTGE